MVIKLPHAKNQNQNKITVKWFVCTMCVSKAVAVGSVCSRSEAYFRYLSLNLLYDVPQFKKRDRQSSKTGISM